MTAPLAIGFSAAAADGDARVVLTHFSKAWRV
jgi:hypothetical protein